MDVFIAELIGTGMLVTLGNGVVANVVLTRTKGNNGGWLLITAAWGLGVAMSAYSVGRISGAHLNPAVTLGLLVAGELEAYKVPLYVAGQMIGAMIGATVVWITYLPHWRETEDQAAKLAAFATGPAIRSFGANFMAELIGTAVLMFGILAIAANAGEMAGNDKLDLTAVFSTGLNPFLVGLLVWSIGMSLGGPTGYAINPARDLGPRIAHMFLPIAGKGDSDWGYAWIPVAGPLVGGVVGALLFRLLDSLAT